ncbi:MAG: thioredoxin domain-containing protein, partial [Methanoregula sp.]|nr:thioredoxin domain-containing protein [Methanoregula sp.]
MEREDPAATEGNHAQPRLSNRLMNEKSPYLLQHATNPVDWYPWGEEAFARALQEDKPVFLSIGYATCHWCHVMAHESFEDTEVAELLNRDFICIKVDREERPDIDSTYMTICQMITGQGGWPLTIIMTADKKPFFAATYLPKERRFSVYGLLDILPRIVQAWHRQRAGLLQSSGQIISALQAPQPHTPAPGDATLLDDGYEDLVLRFDPEYGGFGTAPKFPTPHVLLFLLRYWKRTGKRRALDMAVKTLDAMRDGGICDQIGGGFHRYSTDAQWRVPHFEKMLYDQALLIMAYTEAFQATGNERFRHTAEDIITYVLRDLRSPDGAFFSAEDADSPGGEGAFYLWTRADLVTVLGADDAALAARIFNV